MENYSERGTISVDTNIFDYVDDLSYNDITMKPITEKGLPDNV